MRTRGGRRGCGAREAASTTPRTVVLAKSSTLSSVTGIAPARAHRSSKAVDAATGAHIRAADCDRREEVKKAKVGLFCLGI